MATSTEFDIWLVKKLQQLNEEVDVEVFVSYIQGLLDSYTDDDDVTESLDEIVSQLTESDPVRHRDEILRNWLEHSTKLKEKDENFENKFSDLLQVSNVEKVDLSSVKSKAGPDTKAAIVAQYGNVETYDRVSGDDTDSDPDDALGDTYRNMNAASVKNREVEQREKSKQAAAAKKQKDKDDRAAQKQKEKDRKEQAQKKTQKQERRAR